jgi:PAS domain S-box-containing protein
MMGKCRILLVEDEIIVSLHIRSVLQHFNYEVVEIVPSGEEAIEKAGVHKPDLVLMDIHLSGRVDGIMAAAAIRDKFGIPTIYLTSYNDEETINKAKITEPLGYLVKPIDNSELRNSIELALYKHKTEKKLKESEERYKALFDRSMDLIYLHDFDGKLIDANITTLNLLGYSLNEIKELNISDILMPDQIDLVNGLINEIRNKNSQRTPLECKLKNRNGKLIFVETLVSLIYQSEEPVSVQVLARDITARRQAEEELSLSQQKYRDIFEFAPIGIYRSDPNGVILTANLALANILGYSTIKEILGLNIFKDTCFNNIHENQQISNFFLTGECKDIEILWRTKNNIPTWVQINVHSVKNIIGEILAFEGFVQDINQRKHAEDILIEQEQSYRSLIETSIDAIYVLQDRHLVLINPAWQKLFGYTSEEAYSDDFDIMAIVSPNDLKNISNRFEAYECKTGTELSSSRYEMSGFTKDGKEIQLEVSASEIIWKGKRAVQGIYRDITERKHSEEQIIKLSRAVQQSPASIVITDANGFIEYVNTKFTQITGYSDEEIKGKRPSLLAASILSEDKKKIIQESMDSGLEWKGEFEHKRKDGKVYWETASISPISIDNCKASHFLIILQDITERKKQEEQLIKAKEEAEKSDRLKTEFLAQMSHEIRTPLNNILTYTSILKDEFEDKLPSGLESAFSVINSSSQRLVRTIELILNLSRIQTGNFDTHFKEFDINKDLLEDLTFEFYSRAKVKNIALSYQNKARNTRIVADHYSTEQIFLNLIDNAIKYTTEGEVKIEITNKLNNAVCVSISDTGIGISPDFIPHLFNPFSQEDMGMTRHFDGTGLGLALVKKYVEINNAIIKVESKKGIGSNFMLTFSTAN